MLTSKITTHEIALVIGKNSTGSARKSSAGTARDTISETGHQKKFLQIFGIIL
jgi:alpha-D-ribose 1-methylphosphonate 5-triphosphate diphosphatase PhnM